MPNLAYTYCTSFRVQAWVHVNTWSAGGYTVCLRRSSATNFDSCKSNQQTQVVASNYLMLPKRNTSVLDFLYYFLYHISEQLRITRHLRFC